MEGQSTNQRDFFCFPSARKSQLVLQFFLGKVDAKKSMQSLIFIEKSSNTSSNKIKNFN
jgi:hypothetical protein